MRLSVITVVYNAEGCLEKTLKSVLHQTVSPFEYIIKDGRSTDNTLEIANQYKALFEEKKITYRVISKPDTGIYDAMNQGVDLADGDYIAFLNADDFYEQDALALVARTYAKEKFDFAYGTIRYIGQKGKLFLKPSRLDFIVSSRNWNHPTSIVKKELYIEHCFDCSLGIYADFDWYLFTRKKHPKITIFPKNKVMTNFKIGGVSSSSSIHDALERARQKYYGYCRNGYNKLYVIEAYGWEMVKYMVAKIVVIIGR